MNIPADVHEKITEFNRRFPCEQLNEEEAKIWTHRLCEQMAFSFPEQGYGHKSAGDGRPHSKDCLARNKPGYYFIGWDLVVASGSGAAKLNGPVNESIDLTGQCFEVVIPRNHLGTEPPPVDPPPIVPPPPLVDASAVLAALLTHDATMQASLARLLSLCAEIKVGVSVTPTAVEILDTKMTGLIEKQDSRIDAIGAAMSDIARKVVYPTYEGSFRVLGQSVRFTLTPKVTA